MANKVVNNVDLLNKSSFYVEKPNIFGNPLLILVIIIIALGFAGYAIYYYLNSSATVSILPNSSYYGSDISLYEPIFQENVKTINDCINICKNDITCDGITYNNNTQACLGTKNGQIRNETATYSAWIKPENRKEPYTIHTDFSKAILVGYTKTMTVVNGQKIINPYMLGNFAYSFNITISDFNLNYGSWRHVFHKGTPIETGTILNYQSWENLIRDIPIQTIGVWLAPFTNNLRIAVTTSSLANRTYGSYPDAFVEQCDSLTEECYITDMPGGKWLDKNRLGDDSTPNTRINTYIEFFDHDMQNIPLNKQVNITINFRGQDAEIFLNGKITQIVRLDGVPTINKSNLYVMNNNTFGGELTNILFYPTPLKIPEVKNIMDLVPNITDSNI
uniref:Apple domain-containing protein n=1 Tax=viral metagenome TaxID=1070528 RepID=A0A6C0EY79_9ZZZZ